MKNEIHIIEVENNEKESIKKILKNLDEQKIIYIRDKFNNSNEFLESVDLNGPAIILNSSGTTGKPRKCIHHLKNINSSAAASGRWLKEQGFELEKCFIFNTLPLNHISGLMPLFRSKIWKCDYINISPKLIKESQKLLKITKDIQNKDKKHFITSLVPTQLKRLLSEKDGIKWLQIFDLIWIGGASISSEMSNKCRERKINLAPCYGATETAAMITSLKPKEFLKGHDNVGESLIDTEFKINQKGLIEIKSDRIGIELLESSKTKSFKNKNGWWESSDLGEINKTNDSIYLTVLGRIDKAFNSGGEIVFPKVIKDKLNNFIIRENIPINKFKISKITDKVWGNKFEIVIFFKNQVNYKIIENSLNLLKNFTQSWPKHERPDKWIVAKKYQNKSNDK